MIFLPRTPSLEKVNFCDELFLSFFPTNPSPTIPTYPAIIKRQTNEMKVKKEERKKRAREREIWERKKERNFFF